MRKILLFAAVMLLVPLAAHAQQVAGIDQLLTRFQTVTTTWGGPLQRLAMGTFGILAVIDLVWCVGYRVAMSRGDMSDLLHALVHEIVYLSFFFWLLTTFSTTGPLIIQSFQYAAQQAGGIPTQPNAIFAEGIKIATTITGQISILHPGDSVTLMLCGLIVVGCFAWITAAMVIVIVESFFIISAGQILLMFGGSHFTADMTHNLLRTVVGIGLKLYLLQLIASVGAAFVAAWVTEVHDVSFQGILIEIGESFVLATITAFLPSRFERMVSHVGTGGAGDLVATGGVIAMAGTVMARGIASAAAAVGGMGVATGSAARLASTQQAIAQAGGSGPSSTAGRAAAMIGSTAGNLVSAKATDIGRGLRGQRGNAGQSSWRMSTDLNERNRLLQENNGRPTP